MPSEVAGWDRGTVESLMEAIIDYRGKTPKKTAAGVPLVTAKIIKGGRIKKPTEFIAASGYDSWMRRGLPKVGDVLITTEAPMGEVAQLRSSDVALAQRVILLRGRVGTVNNTFLKFVLQSGQVQAQLRARSSGTTVLGIKQRELRKVELPLPPLDEQRRIAAVLGALDDKIELNRQMNRTLEGMAQAIFESWFIDFEDVPDSEMVESELGLIPKGWRVGKLGDVARQHRLTVKPEEQEPDTPYIGLADMPQGSIALGDWGHASDATSAKAQFIEDDFLFGKLRPYFKKVGVAPCDGICSSDIIVVRPKERHWYGYVLGALTLDTFIRFTTGVSTGTRMPRVSWKAMAGYDLVLPPPERAEEFDARVRPAVARIKASIWESRTLAALRDALLPKLISGEIRVPNAEKAVEAVA